MEFSFSQWALANQTAQFNGLRKAIVNVAIFSPFTK
jgi:hypothetical protein